MNWIGILFAGSLVIGTPIGMAIVLICDHVKARRRKKRCHGRMLNWWELRAE